MTEGSMDILRTLPPRQRPPMSSHTRNGQMQQLGVVEAYRCQAQGCGDIADTVEETLLADVMSASGCLAPIYDCKVCWSDHLEVDPES